MNEKQVDKVARNIVEYILQVKPEQFKNEYENFNDALEIWKNIIDTDIDSAIFGFAGDLDDIQPDILENWHNFYTCEKPQDILTSLHHLKGNDTFKPIIRKPKNDLSERGQKIKEVKLMDEVCRSFNDEDYVDAWLTGGIPDEATEEDYEYYADNTEDYQEIKNLFMSLIQYAERDESGLYNCSEEAFKYAKQFVPKLKNTTYKDGKFIVNEECTQAGAIAGPTGMFGVKPKEKKEESTNIIPDKVQMEIYELIQNGRNIDKQDIETNIQATIEAIKEEYPELEVNEYVRTKALEIYNGDYDDIDLPTDEIYELLSNGMFAGEDIKDNINSTVNEIMNDYGTDYREEDVRNYVEQKAQEIYANELDESKELKTEGLYDSCYKTSDRDELKEIALNAIYVADNDNLIIKELKSRLTDEEKKEWRDDFIGICQHPYDYIANNYYSMPLELLREIALDAVYVANDDEAVQKEIDDRKIENKEIKTEEKLTEQLDELKQRMESLNTKTESNDPRGDKIDKKVEINGIERTLYWQAELDCFNAIVNTIKGLESNVENWSVDFLGGQAKAYVDFKTDDGEGTFEVKFSTDTFGTVEKVETRYSNQNVTYDFIRLAEELYKLKG